MFGAREMTRWLALGVASFALACAHGDTEQAIERNPVFDFGVGAKVLLPGQSIPMPDPNQPGSAPSATEITFLGGSKSAIRASRNTVAGGNPSLRQAAKIPAGIVAAPAAAVWCSW